MPDKLIFVSSPLTLCSRLPSAVVAWTLLATGASAQRAGDYFRERQFPSAEMLVLLREIV